jgi:hypothetical protein
MAKKTKSAAVSADLIHLPADVVKRAKDLLTGAEKKFFDSSFGTALAKATQAQVQAAIKQTRILRNKWRDLYQEQTRSAKRGGKATVGAGAGNARTQDKHEIFAAAVERFEKRLAELQNYVTGASAAPKTTPAKAAKSAPTRAKKAAAKKAVAKKPAIVAHVSAKPVKAISKKARQAAVLESLAKSPATQAIRFDGAKQRSALTAAKAGRIKLQGLDGRRGGHVAARGKRAQARRDMRSR